VSRPVIAASRAGERIAWVHFLQTHRFPAWLLQHPFQLTDVQGTRPNYNVPCFVDHEVDQIAGFYLQEVPDLFGDRHLALAAQSRTFHLLYSRCFFTPEESLLY
jgi:hypothetical protein